MNLLAFSGFFLGLTCLFLGTLILRYGSNWIHKTFALQNLAIAIWGFGCGFAAISQLQSGAFLWWGIAHIGGFLLIVSLLHHAMLLNNFYPKKLLVLLYIWAISFPVFYFLNLTGVKMRYAFNKFYFPQPTNIVYPIYLIIWLAVAVCATALIIRGYRRSHDKEKVSLRLYAIAYIAGLWGGASYIFAVFGAEMGVDFYPYGNFLIPLYCIIIAYTILRHQLLHIEVIVKRTLVFAGLLASVFAILVLPTLLIQEYIFRSTSSGGRLLGLAISGAIIILSLRRIEDFLINITDKFLFQKKYDYKALLNAFTKEVLTVLDLDKLVRLTVDKLSEIIKPESIGILLLDEDKNEYRVVAAQGIKEKSFTLGMDNTLATFLSKTRGHLLVKAHEREGRIPDRVARDMNKLKLELALPLITLQGEMTGILTLGKKKSDEDYTQDDIDILRHLAATLAIAINNAEMFDELGKTQAEAAQKEKMAVIGTLSAGINHEICNPLGIARGQCEAFLLNIRDGLYKSKTPEELM
ncbi:GAF domain-containing protein, partial [Candidatus Omnitrophota bacterium]